MYSNVTRFTAVLSAALLAAAPMLVAQGNDAASSMAADKNFVMLADEGNTAEITASQIALRKSKNPEVIAYAKKMINDHEKLRSDMAPFAMKFGVMTPQPLNPTHKAEDQRLSQLSGSSFDKEYIKNMDTDHHKTLGLFNNELATTSNMDLKPTVQQGQTVVAMHTDMADQLAGKMGVPTIPTPAGE